MLSHWLAFLRVSVLIAGRQDVAMDPLVLATILFLPGLPLVCEWLRVYSLRALLAALAVISGCLTLLFGRWY